MDRGIHCVGEDSLAVIPGPGVELGGYCQSNRIFQKRPSLAHPSLLTPNTIPSQHTSLPPPPPITDSLALIKSSMFCFFKSSLLFIYLAVPGLSCGRWDFHCREQDLFSCSTPAQ